MASADTDLTDFAVKAIGAAMSAVAVAWVQQRRRHPVPSISATPEDTSGARLDRLEIDFRDYKSLQTTMHQENQERMGDLLTELREQRQIVVKILGKMSGLQ